MAPYRGRIAPSPTGCLHLGHARTFWTAQDRARAQGGSLILRNEDLDSTRCRPEFVAAMFEDLRWFGFRWQEGPDCGGAYTPYVQSQRLPLYREAFQRLQIGGFVYPCSCSRQDVRRALTAPHGVDDEPIYPGTCRPQGATQPQLIAPGSGGRQINWRFRVLDGETLEFFDGHYGSQRFCAGTDFGDFVVWRHDDVPAYQLAVVVDDAAMQITEVVRGADLLLSTARQLLLYRALNLPPPAFYHCDLVKDDSGQRLAKRDGAKTLRALREAGQTPATLRSAWA